MRSARVDDEIKKGSFKELNKAVHRKRLTFKKMMNQSIVKCGRKKGKTTGTRY